MKNCLILDENRKLKRQLSRYLSTKDFNLSQATDCQSGLELCNKKMPDVILLGASTPRKSMHCFLQKLEKRNGYQAPLVIYCAEGHDQKSVDEALADGATDYLVLPFNYDLFAFKLRQSGLVS